MRVLLFLLGTLALAGQQHGRTVWKAYPVYPPDKAPADYIEWLRTQPPERIAEPSGDELFQAPAVYGGLAARPLPDPPYTHDAGWFDRVSPPLNREGAVTGYVYVIREKGKVEVGTGSCAMCHTRVLQDGRQVKGGPGNFPWFAALAEDFRASAGTPAARAANEVLFQRLFGKEVPYSPESAARRLAPPATPPRNPDIIGALERRPADFLARHQSRHFRPAESFADAQLETLARYVSGLKTPPSPLRPDRTTRRGEKVFTREGCAGCHHPTSRTAPALNGLWFRGPLGRGGEISHLEEFFEPSRLRYYAGHEFGLNLDAAERSALIAFLRSL